MKIKNFLTKLSQGAKEFDNMRSDPMLFQDDLPPELQRGLFKKYVRLVEFEPHAVCNRQCWHCLNGILSNRHGKLEQRNYEKTIEQLAEIDYSGTIHYARYCEPLLDDRLTSFISIARKALPKAKLKVITNGDFLDSEHLNQLINSGLDILCVSLYLAENVSWSQQIAQNIIQEFGRKIGFKVHFRNKFPNGIFADILTEKIKMDIRCLNFAPEKNGFDRGGMVPNLSQSTFIRSTPCYFVFQTFTIDWNGNVMPCCNIHSDFEPHKDLVSGNIKEQNIFSIFVGKQAVKWRRKLSGYNKKTGPCRHCQDAKIKSFKLE